MLHIDISYVVFVNKIVFLFNVKIDTLIRVL